MLSISLEVWIKQAYKIDYWLNEQSCRFFFFFLISLICTTSKARLWLINCHTNEQRSITVSSVIRSIFQTTSETTTLLSHTSPFHSRPESQLTGGPLSPSPRCLLWKSTWASLERSVVKWHKQGFSFALSGELLSLPLLFPKKIKIKENWLPWVLALHSVAIRHSVSGYHQLVSCQYSMCVCVGCELVNQFKQLKCS